MSPTTIERQATLEVIGGPESKTPVSTATDALVGMLERLAANPDVNVEKLEKLIAMQERILAHNAKAEFDAAFAAMQPDIPQIDERGKILVKGQLRSTYAPLEDIHDIVKPIISKHGFAMRHRTEWPENKPGIIRIVGILSHRAGHSEESSFEASADKSDYRTDIQSQGSTVSYGRRYTTLDLLNISTRGLDKDGHREEPRTEDPDGYAEWVTKLEIAADRGIAILTAGFNEGPIQFRNRLTGTDRTKWAQMKAKAQQVRP